ncbi:DUF5060 domain-containing protein [bacterium]|nr:DUF5060 domain-containing protein [bacterium]
MVFRPGLRLEMLIPVMGLVLLLCSEGLKAQTGTQWYPYLEWSVDNATYSGNKFDVCARVKFTHTASGDTVSSLMFYDSTSTWEGWKFRFTGRKTGSWTYLSYSSDPDLDGLAGSVTINENPDPDAHGFIKNFGPKWGWEGTETTFVPQILMFSTPSEFYDDTGYIDAKIDTFFTQHGFNGFHVRVYCQWFGLGMPQWSGHIDDAVPDVRTFRALEDLITRTHAAGGMVHIWQWGDSLGQSTIDNPGFTLWDHNNTVDQRLQRYIAARLGPLPGWSMGYGYDLDEWVNEQDLETWHTNMHLYLGGWPHFLGGRDPNPNTSSDPVTQIYEGLDYSGYEQWEPPYDEYMRVIDARPSKPSFSEDRFRIRSDPPAGKDYSEEETRRGLYHSAMAGGVANIWGYLLPYAQAGYCSQVYPHPEWIKTWSLFFGERFLPDMIRDNGLTDGMCLRRPDHIDHVFYKEDVTTIHMDLSDMVGPRFAIAVNTAGPYSEIELGWLPPKDTVLTLPSQSDWAVGVGFVQGCYLEAKIFLEGAYETANGEMTADLNDNAVLPLTAPYSEDARTVTGIPAGITDWVLVQLRETGDGEAVTSRSSFLHQDGRVVADDGDSGLIWLDADPGYYYIVIRHRNHVPVMSKDPVWME